MSEQITEQESKEQKEFVESKDNRQLALGLAEDIQTVMGNKWFTVEKLVSKTAESKESAFQKLQLCKMFNLAQSRVGDYKDDRKLLRQVLFKITISDQDRIEGLQRIMDYHQEQLRSIGLEIKFLLNKNNSSEQVNS